MTLFLPSQTGKKTGGETVSPQLLNNRQRGEGRNYNINKIKFRPNKINQWDHRNMVGDND